MWLLVMLPTVETLPTDSDRRSELEDFSLENSLRTSLVSFCSACFIDLTFPSIIVLPTIPSAIPSTQIPVKAKKQQNILPPLVEGE
jgi:hypothetical protein